MKITIEIETDELRMLLDVAHQNNDVAHQVSTPVNLIRAARKLDKAIEEAQPKMEIPLSPEPTANKSKAVEEQPKPGKAPQKGEVPACVVDKIWAPEEINLLRTCRTHKDALFVYDSHFHNKRSEGSIYQRWLRLDRAGDILNPGDNVQVIGGHTCQGKIGDIVKFTDDRQYASIVFFGNPATYQFKINDLKKVKRE